MQYQAEKCEWWATGAVEWLKMKWVEVIDSRDECPQVGVRTSRDDCRSVTVQVSLHVSRSMLQLFRQAAHTKSL